MKALLSYIKKGKVKMKEYSVFDSEFKRYGQVLSGYDFNEMFKTVKAISPKPEDEFIYEASVPELEKLEVAKILKNRAFGGMDIQIGYCNGSNHTLNCLEYHKSSELNIAVNRVVLLLACQSELDDYKLDTSNVKAFVIPEGVGVELYSTTLHYAPCNGEKEGYRVICVLPKGTNNPRPEGLGNTGEDRLCMGTNKWLIAHKEAPEAKTGAFVGLEGANLHI